MLIIDMPKKYLTDASGFVSCAMCQKYLPLLYRDCNNDFKGCLIKGELPEEHGDLIDRDALKKMKVYSPELHEYIVPVAYVDWQQAVVTAERKDDEKSC